PLQFLGVQVQDVDVLLHHYASLFHVHDMAGPLLGERSRLAGRRAAGLFFTVAVGAPTPRSARVHPATAGRGAADGRPPLVARPAENCGKTVVTSRTNPCQPPPEAPRRG